MASGSGDAGEAPRPAPGADAFVPLEWHGSPRRTCKAPRPPPTWNDQGQSTTFTPSNGARSRRAGPMTGSDVAPVGDLERICFMLTITSQAPTSATRMVGCLCVALAAGCGASTGPGPGAGTTSTTGGSSGAASTGGAPAG